MINLKTSSGKTGKVVKQGHTASVFGSDPNLSAKGAAGKAPRDLSV